MSQPTVARFDATPVELDIRIFVRHVAGDQSSVGENSCQSDCSPRESGEEISQDVVVHEIIPLPPRRLEFLDPSSGSQQNDTAAIEQDIAAIKPNRPHDLCLSELEAIRIEYERARPTKTRKDYILPLQDWVCILSIIGFELTAIVLLLGN